MNQRNTSQAAMCANLHRESQVVVHRITDGLSDHQFNWRPEPSAWSVAQCIVHLNLVADAYLPRFEAAIINGAPRAHGPFTWGFVARKMIDGVRPGGPKVRTGAALDPGHAPSASAFDRGATLEQFDALVRRYVAVCERAEGLDLERIKVRYPFLPLLRLPFGAFLEITGQHALRHARQAEQVTQERGFPS